MARGRNNNKLTKRKKFQPAVMQMEFIVPTGTSYIDLSLAASIVNRRAYKQQNTNWAVASFEFLSSGSGSVAIAKLPETWVYHNAYEKSWALWNKMNDQVLDDEPSIQGKYHDFKIYLDDNMRQQSIQCTANPAGTILTPSFTDPATGLPASTLADFTGAAAPRANWDYSTIQIPYDGAAPGATTEYFLHGVGADTADSKGLIDGYALSRSRPQEQDPNVPLAEGWMNELFDLGENNEEIRDDLVDDNDRPPYALIGAASVRETYPGGSEEFDAPQLHGFCNFTATTVSAKNSIQGGMFANGLIAIANNTGGSMNLLLHMMPGDHRGYLCEELIS